MSCYAVCRGTAVQGLPDGRQAEAVKRSADLQQRRVRSVQPVGCPAQLASACRLWCKDCYTCAMQVLRWCVGFHGGAQSLCCCQSDIERHDIRTTLQGSRRKHIWAVSSGIQLPWVASCMCAGPHCYACQTMATQHILMMLRSMTCGMGQSGKSLMCSSTHCENWR